VKGFRGWWLLVVVVVVVVALVTGVPPAGTEAAEAALAQETPVEEDEEESSVGVEDLKDPLPSTAAEANPAVESITLGDLDEDRVVVPPESIRLELPAGDHRATPVVGDRVQVDGLPIAVVTDEAGFGRDVATPQVRVLVDAAQPETVPGSVSSLFTVDFVDATDRVVTPVEAATVEVDLDFLPGGLYGNLRDRLEFKWFEGCHTESELVVDEASPEGDVAPDDAVAEFVDQTVCDRVIDVATTRDLEGG
jgi:hypothetical protein